MDFLGKESQVLKGILHHLWSRIWGKGEKGSFHILQENENFRSGHRLSFGWGENEEKEELGENEEEKWGEEGGSGCAVGEVSQSCVAARNVAVAPESKSILNLCRYVKFATNVVYIIDELTIAMFAENRQNFSLFAWAKELKMCFCLWSNDLNSPYLFCLIQFTSNIYEWKDSPNLFPITPLVRICHHISLKYIYFFISNFKIPFGLYSIFNLLQVVKWE